MVNGIKSTCAGCGKLIDDGERYASIGGNIVPYSPAHLYHMQCIPAVQPAYRSRAIGADDYEFQLCEVCTEADPQPATFIVSANGVNHYYCEEHGTSQKLSRGIPGNHAEPESRCSYCQSPLEEGHICSDCAARTTLQTNAHLVEKFLESPDRKSTLAAEGLRAGFEALNKRLAAPYNPPKIFTYAPRRLSVEWFKQHVDHFIISFMVGIPLLVANAIASNIFTHHVAQILRALRIPATIMRWLGY